MRVDQYLGYASQIQLEACALNMSRKGFDFNKIFEKVEALRSCPEHI
jgi:hypothetical protein